MVVCHCAGINDTAVREAIADGVTDVDALRQVCGVAKDCGGCERVVEALLVRTRPLGARG